MKIIPFSLSQSPPKEYNTPNGNDEKVILGIINNDDKAIRAVYREYKLKIRKMVFTFRNTMLDPDDVFQEGLTRMVMNIREGRFRGESSVYTYLSSICRNICLKELSRHKISDIGLKDFNIETGGIDYDVLNRILWIRQKLEEKCREIIDLRFDLDEGNGNPSGESKPPGFEEIAEKLGLTPDNTRQRFKRCLDKLKVLVRNDAELKDFKVK